MKQDEVRCMCLAYTNWIKLFAYKASGCNGWKWETSYVYKFIITDRRSDGQIYQMDGQMSQHTELSSQVFYIRG